MVRESVEFESHPRQKSGAGVGSLRPYAPVLGVVALSVLFVGARPAFAPLRRPTGAFGAVEVVGLPVAETR